MHAEVMPQHLFKQINSLEPLCARLMVLNDSSKKLDLIQSRTVIEFLKTSPILQEFTSRIDVEREFVLKSIIAIGQGDVVLRQVDDVPNPFELLSSLVETLLDIEKFYRPIGGIVGYHLMMLKLISEKEKGQQKVEKNIRYFKPEGMDLSKKTAETNKTVRWGLEHLKNMAEIYPLGGAADRLQLKDETNGEPLPSAQLLFMGRPLLAGLVRDLQGREYLYYKLFDKQLVTPIAMMTSHEKNNHERVINLMQSHHWFERPETSFRLFIQPMVPVLTVQGNWAMSEPLKVILKPGGHGVIWKTAMDSGAFDWLQEQKREKALVRQINNPVAGVDNGLLALSGIGCHKNKDFGFASCQRKLNIPEGMNVLIEKKTDEGYEYRISNIEYTDFEQKGIEEAPEEPGSPYSVFPANTNILFVDIEAVKKAVEICPIPGMLINMKTTVTSLDLNGKPITVKAGRLESTMQNIADVMINKFPHPLKEGQRNELHTFLTYNLRRKTISVTKETYTGKCLIGTPQGCFYELMQDYHDLLTNYCHIETTPFPEEKNYNDKDPTLVIDFHPGLGGLYSVISQKIHGGQLAHGAEWIMEIAEADIKNLRLKGSLHILADKILGHQDAQGSIVYSSHCGKCTLKNVTVENEGIDLSQENRYWKKEITRKECLQIILHGNAEIFAENVTFSGGGIIEVPGGHRLTVTDENGAPSYQLEKIESPTWKWEYVFDQDDDIKLNRVER